MLRIMEGADADIMCFGHTHKPYHRILPIEPADRPHYRHVQSIPAQLVSLKIIIQKDAMLF